jgi:hypothetical protein
MYTLRSSWGQGNSLSIVKHRSEVNQCSIVFVSLRRLRFVLSFRSFVFVSLFRFVLSFLSFSSSRVSKKVYFFVMSIKRRGKFQCVAALWMLLMNWTRFHVVLYSLRALCFYIRCINWFSQGVGWDGMFILAKCMYSGQIYAHLLFARSFAWNSKEWN